VLEFIINGIMLMFIVEDRELNFIAVPYVSEPCQQDFFFLSFPVPFNKQCYKREVTILMDNSFGLI